MRPFVWFTHRLINDLYDNFYRKYMRNGQFNTKITCNIAKIIKGLRKSEIE